jgi:hypothetical protein
LQAQFKLNYPNIKLEISKLNFTAKQKDSAINKFKYICRNQQPEDALKFLEENPKVLSTTYAFLVQITLLALNNPNPKMFNTIIHCLKKNNQLESLTINLATEAKKKDYYVLLRLATTLRGEYIDGKFPLIHIAIQNRWLELIYLLVAHDPACVTYIAHDGEPPLLFAAQHQWLLLHRLSNQLDSKGEATITYPSSEDEKKIKNFFGDVTAPFLPVIKFFDHTKMLTNQINNPKYDIFNYIKFPFASSIFSLDFILSLDLKFIKSYRNNDDKTLFERIIDRKNQYLSLDLIKIFPKILDLENPQDKELFFYTLKHVNDKYITRYLIEMVKDINMTNKEGISLLEFCIKHFRCDAILLIINKGAKVDSKRIDEIFRKDISLQFLLSRPVLDVIKNAQKSSQDVEENGKQTLEDKSTMSYHF